MFDFFKANEQEQYLFLQLPLMLIKDEQFKGLSDSAKILYSLLLNRTSLSAKNGWTDEQGNVYIIYTIEEIMADLNCWKEKATKAMKELKTIGLVKSIRQGLGRPNIIYVMNFATALKYQSKNEKKPENLENTQSFGNRTSRVSEIELQEGLKTELQQVRNSNPIYNDFKKDLQNNIEIESESKSTSDSTTELSTAITEKTDRTRTIDNDTQHTKIFEMKKEPSSIPTSPSEGLNESSSANTQYFTNDFSTIEKVIQDNIQYKYFRQDSRDIELVNNFVACMVDTMLTDDNVKITIGNGKNKETKPISVVKSVLMRINHEHIQHALDQYKGQHRKITYKIPYMRNMLYNTYIEMDAHYTNQVRADGLVY